MATYRLQLREGMTFARAAALAPQIAGLGITHLYLSPIFEAVRGSTHGYDVTDNTVIDRELGGEAGFQAMADAFRRHGIGILLDFVPNHMAASPQNPWWRDVLEWGAAAEHAQHFDIDWSAPKLIVPVLDGNYGRVLEQGELGLAFDAAAGEITMTYAGLALPLTPPSYADILSRTQNTVLGDLAGQFAASTPATGRALKSALAQAVRDPDVAARVGQALDETKANRSALHALHERQPWRLTHWRAAREMLTYRRFFEISDLVGVKVEVPQVFDDVHAHLNRLVRDGFVDGIRLDHIDGLADPKGYLDRLQEMLPGEEQFYLLVEKILGPDETVRQDWPVAGTTGYEFIRFLAVLLVDSAGEPALTRAYNDFVGADVEYEDLVRAIKRHILTHNLAGELRGLTRIAHTLAVRHPDTRDFGADTLRAAIVELATALPVYRTYVTAAGADAQDRAILEGALQAATRTRQIENEAALDFVRHLVLTEAVVADRARVVEFAVRFQQMTGPLMAKAVEDTTFYRYNRLLALNEVGGEPSVFGAPPATFHRAMSERLEQQPAGLSTTATHDTKRGEDARARLYALSEMPDAWSEATARWREQNRALKQTVQDHALPDADAEWAFYEALAGAWPLELAQDNPFGLAALAERMTQFAIKAAREAKLHTTWTHPNTDYEKALENFVRGTLEPGTSQAFLADFAGVHGPIAIAGAVNSLAQTVIKLTAPGIPDVYQGTELWDFSLVDPDNRRAIDFERIASLASDGGQRDVTELVRNWRSGAIKLHLLQSGLKLRRERPALFASGAYIPLEVVGEHQQRVVSFARVLDGESVIAVAPRLALGLLDGEDVPMVPPARWGTTAVVLPAAISDHQWIDVCTGRTIEANDQIALASILEMYPVALLASSGV